MNYITYLFKTKGYFEYPQIKKGEKMATTLDNKTPLGKMILKNLYLKGKNQAWLAQQIHVKPNHICILCSRTICPKAETLLKISKALDIDVGELYKAVAETVENNER